MDIKELESHLKINNYAFDEPTLEALNYYTKKYMLTVPFENIDVQNKVRISVTVEDIYNKVVRQNRGGYCYEMNHLFQSYLKEKGFYAHIVSATIHTPNGGRSQPGSHVSLVVCIDGIDYVADVGFGDLPTHVMPITIAENTQSIEDKSGTFRAIFQNEQQDSFFVQKWEDNHWNTKYEAGLSSKTIEDFAENIEYNQSNPNSIFVKRLIITMPKSYGRVTMSQNYLTITKGDKKKKTKITKQNYQSILKEYFNLDVIIQRLEIKH
ncbi:TPA: arylamine N-acetyltransferase [Staphylococcus delphini]|nr:arylamine N-acetyltransferase [Staphylococcus delphini]HEC2209579.1 arylamine N-acetyltransferase [Staphylococcus delphini]HEC2218255.1 arylamine N-acetyltransferase [Staphylococcus delphini]HEC2229711.1 arylamine N-acetyltransferase [Staphylococcus delphini]